MIDPGQFRNYIIDPAIKQIGLYSPSASNLLLGTALQESGLQWLHQIHGPALGFWQIEPATHADLWDSFLIGRKQLAATIQGMMSGLNRDLQLVNNLAYAAAMARVFYYRIQEALPNAQDAPGMAAYYKRYYNTPAGAATVEQAQTHFQKAIDVG